MLNTANLPEGMTHPDAVSKWLVITRAAVFSMTATVGADRRRCWRSARRGSTGEVSVNWLCLVLAVVGLVVAHAANNMINDYFDLEGGVDTDDYVRALYAPHPILSGWVTKRQLGDGDPARQRDRPRDHAVPDRRARAARHRVRPGRPVHLGLLRRPADPAQAPRPRRARRVHRLGPADGRSARSSSRPATIPAWVWIASLPYAILVTTVLFGKHIDKIEADTKKGVRTLPVILGERRARAVARALMIAFYPIVVGAALVGWIGPWVALVVLGDPAAALSVLRTFAVPRPETPPHSYVGWPLWFVGAAFIHTRRAGGLLVLGLLLNALLPVHLPWPSLGVSRRATPGRPRGGTGTRAGRAS